MNSGENDALSRLVERERSLQQFEWTGYTRTFFLSYNGTTAIVDPRCTNWRQLFARLARGLRRRRGTSRL